MSLLNLLLASITSSMCTFYQHKASTSPNETDLICIQICIQSKNTSGCPISSHEQTSHTCQQRDFLFMHTTHHKENKFIGCNNKILQNVTSSKDSYCKLPNIKKFHYGMSHLAEKLRFFCYHHRHHHSCP